MRIRFAITVMLVATPHAASAQLSGPYQLSLGDTLRFDETTDTEVVVQTPQGSISVTSEHRATVGLAVTGGSEATGWFEALALRSLSPAGDTRPETSGLLGQPYRLDVGSTGLVELIEAPPQSAEILAVTDLTHEFADFLISVPTSRPSAGDSWQDTLSVSTSAVQGATVEGRTIRRFTIRGDTIYEGSNALLIDVEAEMSLESTSPMEGQPLTVTTRVSGVDSGIAVFEWEAGRMLMRSRSGELTGTFTINAPQPLEMPQSMSFTSRIEAIR